MQGGAVGSKSYCTVVEIHGAAIIRTLTSPVAAIQLAANAFLVKMATQDLTSPVAANHLAAGAFFSGKMTPLGNAGAAARGVGPPPGRNSRKPLYVPVWKRFRTRSRHFRRK